MTAFDWDDFRHFAALAQTLHLGDAAARLQTSQVTVMRRVKALEHQLGVILFVRRRDGHRLTTSGKRLLGLAQEAEHVLSSVEVAAKRSDNDRIGRVRIATTEVAANWILLPQLPKFLQGNPRIKMEIDASPTDSDLLEDTETLALRFRRPNAGNYVVRRLGTVPYAIYAAKKLTASNDAKSASSTKEIPFVGWAGQFSEISLARWMRTSFDGSSPILSITTLGGHIEAARLGIGVVGIARLVGRQLPDLVELSNRAPAFSLEAWMVVPSQVRAIPRIKAAVKFVEEAVKAALR
jgi:DNA-binding transcriptional LysR family regulator